MAPCHTTLLTHNYSTFKRYKSLGPSPLALKHDHNYLFSPPDFVDGDTSLQFIQIAAYLPVSVLEMTAPPLRHKSPDHKANQLS